MTVTTMKSEEARQAWRDILDSVYPGDDAVVVERYNKPMAVLIGYDKWQEMLQQLRLAKADAALQQGEFVTDAELEAGLKQRGLL